MFDLICDVTMHEQRSKLYRLWIDCIVGYNMLVHSDVNDVSASSSIISFYKTINSIRKSSVIFHVKI